MIITLAKYERAKKELQNLAKHQETVKAWDAAMKGYKPAEGFHVAEIQIKDGKTRHITEKTEAPALFQKTG